jgi:four helix bundle protein
MRFRARESIDARQWHGDARSRGRHRSCSSNGMGFQRIEDIDAWQLARTFKIGIYKLIERDAIARDFELRDQLRDAAASAPSHISEGFGRFDPVDFARFVKMARGWIQECRNHLIDAADRGHISDAIRQEHDARASRAP